MEIPQTQALHLSFTQEKVSPPTGPTPRTHDTSTTSEKGGSATGPKNGKKNVNSSNSLTRPVNEFNYHLHLDFG